MQYIHLNIYVHAIHSCRIFPSFYETLRGIAYELVAGYKQQVNIDFP